MKTRYGNYIVESDEDFIRLHYKWSAKNWLYSLIYVAILLFWANWVISSLLNEIIDEFNWRGIILIILLTVPIYYVHIFFGGAFKLITKNIIVFDKKAETVSVRLGLFKSKTFFKEKLREIEFGLYNWDFETPGENSTTKTGAVILGKLVTQNGEKFDIVSVSSNRIADTYQSIKEEEAMEAGKPLIVRLSKELQIGKRWMGKIDLSDE